MHKDVNLGDMLVWAMGDDAAAVQAEVEGAAAKAEAAGAGAGVAAEKQ